MQWTLVDMRTARADEVERVVLHLGLHERTEVLGFEAQYLGHQEGYRESFDVVVARSFGPSSLTAECAAGLVSPEGVFIVSEPPVTLDGDEARWSVESLAILGFSPASFVEADGTKFAVFRKVSATPTNVPRLPPRPNRGWL
jgi:hypothetical protein